MVIVTLREERQKLRQQRHFRFDGMNIPHAVKTALRLMYGESELDSPVTSVGGHHRILQRQALFPRKLVVTVRVQCELWG